VRRERQHSDLSGVRRASRPLARDGVGSERQRSGRLERACGELASDDRVGVSAPAAWRAVDEVVDQPQRPDAGEEGEPAARGQCQGAERAGEQERTERKATGRPR
jgi:hypothetical protein